MGITLSAAGDKNQLTLILLHDDALFSIVYYGVSNAIELLSSQCKITMMMLIHVDCFTILRWQVCQCTGYPGSMAYFTSGSTLLQGKLR